MENELSSKVISDEESIEDTTCWSLTNNGKFTVKSAYELITDKNELIVDNFWNSIWKLDVPYRIRAFLWKESHGKLMCNSERVKMVFASNSNCGICQNSIEDMEHILRKCKKARNVWNKLDSEDGSQLVDSLSFDEWLRMNLNPKKRDHKAMDWSMLFAISLWGIWLWRNKLIFEEKIIEANSKVNWIKNNFKVIKASFPSPRVMPLFKYVYANTRVRWTPPPTGGYHSMWMGAARLKNIRRKRGNYAR